MNIKARTAAASLGFLLLSVQAEAQIVAAVLPELRAAGKGSLLSLFATIINAGSETATGCGISLTSDPDIDFVHHTIDDSGATGPRNEKVNIAAGQGQKYYMELQSSVSFTRTLQFDFDCESTEPAPVFRGVNTFTMVNTDAPTPEMLIGIGVPFRDQIMRVGRESQTLAFSAQNTGIRGFVTGYVEFPDALAELSRVVVEETWVERNAILNQDTGFNSFISVPSTTSVPPDYVNNRIRIYFQNSEDVIIGQSSVPLIIDPDFVNRPPVITRFEAYDDGEPYHPRFHLEVSDPESQSLICKWQTDYTPGLDEPEIEIPTDENGANYRAPTVLSAHRKLVRVFAEDVYSAASEIATAQLDLQPYRKIAGEGALISYLNENLEDDDWQGLVGDVEVLSRKTPFTFSELRSGTQYRVQAWLERGVPLARTLSHRYNFAEPPFRRQGVDYSLREAVNILLRDGEEEKFLRDNLKVMQVGHRYFDIDEALCLTENCKEEVVSTGRVVFNAGDLAADIRRLNMVFIWGHESQGIRPREDQTFYADFWKAAGSSWPATEYPGVLTDTPRLMQEAGNILVVNAIARRDNGTFTEPEVHCGVLQDHCLSALGGSVQQDGFIHTAGSKRPNYAAATAYLLSQLPEYDTPQKSCCHTQAVHQRPRRSRRG